MTAFPAVTPATLEALEEHNRRAGALLDNWYRHSGGAWTPGMITPPELRGRLESFVPWREVRTSLARLGSSYLPGPTWLPGMLQPGGLDSILDLWEELPEWAGRIRLRPEELLPFFCACADPPRHGTDCGRYPSQTHALAQLCPPGAALLDLGCGIGLGTLETADRLHCRAALGITAEPMEAWMATRRQLPHDPERSRHFLPFQPGQCHCQFQAADVLDFQPQRQFQVVICNGLAGGRFLHQEPQLRRLLAQIRDALAPGGILALANHFHEGWRPTVEQFLRFAAESGLRTLQDHWQNAILQG